MAVPDAPDLPRRFAIASALARLVFGLAGYGLILFVSPQAHQLRALYAQPAALGPMVARGLAAILLAGLAAWCVTRRWLARRGAGRLARPGRTLAGYVGLLWAGLLAAEILQAYSGVWLAGLARRLAAPGGGMRIPPALFAALLSAVAAAALELLCAWAALRVALWRSRTAGGAAPAYTADHAAAIAAASLLVWQWLIVLGLVPFLGIGLLERQSSLAAYALGYWALPAALAALALAVNRRHVPRALGGADAPRAVAHGSLSFWLAQAAGIGLVALALMNVDSAGIQAFSRSPAAPWIRLLAYAALQSLSCALCARLLYGRRGGAAPAAAA